MLTKYRTASGAGQTSHFMCGAGGETLGFALEGFDPAFNTNHSQRVIKTIEANFPNTNTKVADVSNINFRSLPRTSGATGSPICQEGSPAGGGTRKVKRAKNTKWNPDQPSMLTDKEAGPVDDAAWEKTRLTAYCLIRATEVVDYDWVFFENVVEFARDWPLFTWWLKGWEILGYNVTLTCVTAAHVGTDDVDPVAQWRNRVVGFFTKKGIPTPDLSLNPWAPCVCGEDVQAVRWWKDPAKSSVGPHMIGKYGEQYLWRTPHRGSCRQEIVEPYIVPAASFVDWNNLGQRVGDRVKRPIVPARRARIQQGLDMHYGEPYVTMARRNAIPTHIGQPIASVTTSGTQHYLTVPHPEMVPGIVIPYRKNNLPTTTDEPIPTVSTKPTLALVIPHRRNDRISTTDEPRPTVLTRDFTRLAVPAPAVDDVLYRMFTSNEHLLAQGFPTWYDVTGNGEERNAQAGNAVPVNVARWAARRMRASLDSRSAA